MPPRVRRPPSKMNLMATIPFNAKEALQGADSKEWKAAMISEMDSMHENGVWELVDAAPGGNL